MFHAVPEESASWVHLCEHGENNAPESRARTTNAPAHLVSGVASAQPPVEHEVSHAGTQGAARYFSIYEAAHFGINEMGGEETVQTLVKINQDDGSRLGGHHSIEMLLANVETIVNFLPSRSRRLDRRLLAPSSHLGPNRFPGYLTRACPAALLRAPPRLAGDCLVRRGGRAFALQRLSFVARERVGFGLCALALF